MTTNAIITRTTAQSAAGEQGMSAYHNNKESRADTAITPIRNMHSWLKAVFAVLALALTGAAWAAVTTLATLTTTPNPSIVGNSVALTVILTASNPNGKVLGNAPAPSGAVTYLDGATVIGTATLDATGAATLNYTFTNAGAHTLTVNYAGSTRFAASTSNAVSQTVNKAPTITGLTSSPNPSIVGNAVTLTATVTGYNPSGAVTFYDGAIAIGTVTVTNGTATLSYTFTNAANHSLTASYGGDGNNLNSASTALAQTVDKAPTTTGLNSSPNPSIVGNAVTLTATVTGYNPSGAVTFYDGATAIGTGAVTNGTATLSYTFTNAVNHSLTASYGGDGNNLTSASTALAQTVDKAPTTTGLNSSPNPSIVGNAVTLTATVTGYNPSGAVTFYDGTTAIGTGTVTNGTATLSYTFTNAANHILTASYGGDGNNLTSASAALAQTVDKALTTTGLTSSPNPSIVGNAVTLTATVTGYNPSGAVTFYDGATAIGTGTVTNGTATLNYTFTNAASHSLTASYAGDTNNLASASAAVSQSVDKTPTATALAATPNPATAGQPATLTATVSGYSPGGTVTFMDGATAIGAAIMTNGTATLGYAFTNAGAHSLSANYGGDANNQAGTSAVVSVTVKSGVAQAYYIHADHLDTPRVITDTQGNKVWEWPNVDPFGNNMPNENPNGAGIFTFNLGFPGQYRDRETNTFYNTFRDAYDSATGRYTQFDPIGLDGGINGYTYALNNPLRGSDPTGLCVEDACVIETTIAFCARFPSACAAAARAAARAASAAAAAVVCAVTGACSTSSDEGSSDEGASCPAGADTAGTPPEGGDEGGDKQKKGKPKRNTDQNKRVDDAAREAGLDRTQRKLLGRIVEQDTRQGGANYTYQDIKAIADEIKAGRSHY